MKTTFPTRLMTVLLVSVPASVALCAFVAVRHSLSPPSGVMASFHVHDVIASHPTPLSDNPWHKYHSSTTPFQSYGSILQTEGIRADKDPKTGKLLFGTGTYPWSPGSVSYPMEVNSGSRVTQNIPSNIVPVGSVGTVYYQFVKNRLTFLDKHSLNDGSQAKEPEILQNGYVDRPTGGVSFVIWVQDAGADWPESTTLNLDSM